MLKNILSLEGAQQLSKSEQSSINGGAQECRTGCPYRLGLDCWWCID